MTQTGIPASGMWGPGDYPEGFETIDEAMVEYFWPAGMASAYVSRRMAVRDALIDLAHDLDARGFVVCERDTAELGEAFRASLNDVTDTLFSLSPEAQARIEAEMADDTPPDPNTGS